MVGDGVLQQRLDRGVYGLRPAGRRSEGLSGRLDRALGGLVEGGQEGVLLVGEVLIERFV